MYVLKSSVNHLNYWCEKLRDRSERWIYLIYMTKGIRSLFCSDRFNCKELNNNIIRSFCCFHYTSVVTSVPQNRTPNVSSMNNSSLDDHRTVQSACWPAMYEALFPRASKSQLSLQTWVVCMRTKSHAFVLMTTCIDIPHLSLSWHIPLS